jgi:hypothetical protein
VRQVALIGRDLLNPCAPSLHRLWSLRHNGAEILVCKPGRTQLRRHTLSFLLLLSFVITASPVSAKKRARDLFGLKIGMSEESVHKKLKKIATQQKEEKEKEEEGEQEVWSLKKDDRFDYILTRFNRDHRLTLITVVARPDRVRYSDVADTKEATVASDGRNYSYRWKVERDGRQPAYLLIARGSSSEFLTSYSLYPAK